jgi:transposase-like protein
MATYRSPEERRDLVRSWRQSGLSAERFAASRGLSKSSLLRWRAEHVEVAAVASPPAPRLDFVRLVQQARPVVARGLVLEIAGARVRVEAGFDPELLASVVATLRGAS